ncbi:MAG: efflux RND transporter periplasmic adaptor subunit [Burkholderiales bacterium]
MGYASKAKITVVAGVLAAVTSGCGKQPEAVAEPRLVTVVKVSMGDISGERSYSGEVRARYETSLSFRLPGKIVARQVEVGGLVRKGDVLARLDPEDQHLNTRSAQSQLAAAQSEYEQIKAEVERYADLFKQQFISKTEYDRRVSGLDVAKARLEQAQAQLAVTRNQAAYTELAADGPGVVTAIQFEVGQVVAAGQGIVRIARTDEREVVINVPENRLAELGDAKDIAVTLWANPSKFYRGKVREISPTADAVTRTYAGKISVLDADPAMKLGMTANVFLKGITRGGAAILPATALFQDNGKPAVWVIDPSSRQVNLVQVNVGEYAEDQITVLSGLQSGDIVVRAGVHKLFAGEKVRVQEQSAAEAAR